MVNSGAVTRNESIEIFKLERRLSMYQRAINEIDDYFEYRMESKKDQEEVRSILKKLTESIT